MSPTKMVRPWDYPHLAFHPHLATASGFLNPNRCLLPFGAGMVPGHPPALHAPPFGNPYGLHPQALSFHPFQRGPMATVGLNVNVGFSSASHLSPSSGSLRASSASPYSGSSDVHDTDGDADDLSIAGSASGSPSLAHSASGAAAGGANRQKSLLNSGSVVNSHNSGSTAGCRKSAKKPASPGRCSSAAKSSSAKPAGTPLDALFQMTSKTFEGASAADASGKSFPSILIQSP